MEIVEVKTSEDFAKVWIVAKYRNGMDSRVWRVKDLVTAKDCDISEHHDSESDIKPHTHREMEIRSREGLWAHGDAPSQVYASLAQSLGIDREVPSWRDVYAVSLNDILKALATAARRGVAQHETALK